MRKARDGDVDYWLKSRLSLELEVQNEEQQEFTVY